MKPNTRYDTENQRLFVWFISFLLGLWFHLTKKKLWKIKLFRFNNPFEPWLWFLKSHGRNFLDESDEFLWHFIDRFLVMFSSFELKIGQGSLCSLKIIWIDRTGMSFSTFPPCIFFLSSHALCCSDNRYLLLNVMLRWEHLLLVDRLVWFFLLIFRRIKASCLWLYVWLDVAWWRN